jgi:TolB protein
MMTRPHPIRCLALVGAVPALMSLVGCATPPRPSPWPSDPIAFQPTEFQERGTTPSAFGFHGDNPAYDHVPYENRMVGNFTRHTFTHDGLDFDPDLDAIGEEMVFASTRNSVHPDIYIKQVDSTAVMQLTSDPADDIQPRYSPNAEQVVFSSNRSGNWDLWLVNRDGTGLRQLTFTPNDEIAPSWSPDGQQIAFSQWSPRQRRWELWTLSVEQPGLRRFLTYGMFPAWSPSGEQIAFQRARERGTRWFSVWTIDLVDGEARRPTEIAHSARSACIAPRWSPDGEMIVYCEVRDIPQPAVDGKPTPPRTHAEIWVVGARDGQRFKITDSVSPSFNPAWSATNRIYFVSTRQGTENIWSTRSTVTANANPGDVQTPQVSRSGARIAPGATEQQP